MFKKNLFGIPFWVYLAAFLPRLLLLVLAAKNPAYCVTADSRGYLDLAASLSGSGFFGLPAAGGAVLADTFRTPGYPMLLVAVGSLPGDIVFNAVFAQLLISALTVLLAWKWFNEMAGRRGAGFGVLFFSLDYISLMHAPLLLAEELLMLVLVLAGRATWRTLEGGTAAGVSKAGFLWALAAFIKPITLYLPLMLAPLLWKRKKQMFLFLLLAYSIPLAWSYRNYAHTGYFTYTSIGGVVLLKYSAGSVEALRTGKSFAETSAALLAEAEGDYPSDAARSSAYSARAVKIIKKYPGLTARYLLHDLLATVGGSGIEMLPQALGLNTEVKAQPGAIGSGTLALLRVYPALWALQAGYLVFLAAVYLLFARGVWVLARSGRLVPAAFLFAAVFYLFAMASTNGYYRYRIPPMLFLAAGAAIALGREGAGQRPGHRPTTITD